MIKILLPLLTFSFLSYAGPRNIAATDTKVTEGLPADKLSCLKSMADASTTPSFAKNYFESMGGEENFTMRCHVATDPENMRFLFLSEAGIRSLKLPLYHYTVTYRDGGSDETELPRNVIHFKYQQKDYYIALEYADNAHINTLETLPKVATQQGTTLAKIQSEYVKKYESWLKTQKLIDVIELKQATEADLEVLLPCLETKIQYVVDGYVSGKFRPMIPAYGVMMQNYQSPDQLPQEVKDQYKRPFADFEKEVMDDMLISNPSCQGVVRPESVKAVFDKTFSKNKQVYETLRMRFFPK